MRIVVAKAALSKARRDAIFQVVPRALCKPIEAAARNVITGSTKPLSERRAAVLAWIGKSSIGEARVWAALGIKSVKELGNDQLVELQGIRTAIKEGEVTIDDAFPKIEGATESVGVDRFTSPKSEGNPVEPVKESKPAKQSAPKPTPPKDPRADLMAIIETKGCTVDDFVEGMVYGESITQEDYNALIKLGRPLTLADVATAMVFEYLGADNAGAAAIKVLDKVIASRPGGAA
jgi:hypothetical protein